MSCVRPSTPILITYVVIGLVLLVALIYSIVEAALFNDKYYPKMAYKGDAGLAVAVMIFVIINIVTLVAMMLFPSLPKFVCYIGIGITVITLIIGITFGIITKGHYSTIGEKLLHEDSTDPEVIEAHNAWLKKYCKEITIILYDCTTKSANNYIKRRTIESGNTAIVIQLMLAVAGFLECALFFKGSGQDAY